MQEKIHKLLLGGKHKDPHSVLGLQPVDEKKWVIRLWRPDADRCQLLVKDVEVEAKNVHGWVFEHELKQPISPIDYIIIHHNGDRAHDPYAFQQVFGELDIHLIKKGLHYELYDLLGATPKAHQGIEGVNFAVWAPNAQSVSLIGEFNQWNGCYHPMRAIDTTGVWELFIPGLKSGVKYKFEIVTYTGERVVKSDPVGHFCEVRPDNSSIVFNTNEYIWSDQAWMEKRGHFRNKKAPIYIYEMHPGSWKKKNGEFLNWRELAEEAITYCKEMSYTHVELIGICEHPLDESWGYQVTGYFAPTSRHGTPSDFQAFVDALHLADIGVIIDWVPGHFPTDSHSICRFDGTCLYEYEDPRLGFHPKWQTQIFNYGRFEVSNFLIASALFWLDKMHVDGIRVDAVTSMLYLDFSRESGEWLPNKEGTNINLEAVEFLKHFNSMIHDKFPDVLTIAEEATAFPKVTGALDEGGLGFDLKWNLGWSTDTLTFFQKEEKERLASMDLFRWPASYAFQEKFVLILSHDDVSNELGSLYEKMPGDKLANLRLLLSYHTCFPGKKLLFMGSEIGQKEEWDCKGEMPWQLLDDPAHKALYNMMQALGHLYLEHPALIEGDMQLVEGAPKEVFAYFRRVGSQRLLCVHHPFSKPVEKAFFPIPGAGSIKEIFNTDRREWGGSGTIETLFEKTSEGFRVEISPLATQIFLVDDN